MTDIQTPQQGTEKTEPVTQEEITKEIVAPKETTPVEAETPPEEPAPEQTQPESDPFKDKFVASQREAILLAERNKLANQKLENLTKQDSPTDEAMRQLYPEWDQLDDYNKRVLIRQEATNMKTAKLELELADSRAERQLDNEVDNLIESTDVKYAKLRGREADFRRFAKRPANKGISADILAQAFLFDAEDTTPHTPAIRSGLEKGSGGPKEAPTTEGMTLDDEAELMKADPGRYAELIRKGVIK